MYFRSEIEKDEVILTEGILHHRMDNHGHHFHHHHTHLPAGLGEYILVGPAKVGSAYDGDFLGLALSVSDTILETQSGRKE